MKSRSSLKRRILSTGLAIAMLLPYVPEGLLPKARATTFEKTQSLTINSDGSYEILFETADTSVASLGSPYFVLMPDVGIDASGTISSMKGPSFSAGNSGAFMGNEEGGLVSWGITKDLLVDKMGVLIESSVGDDRIPLNSGVVSITSGDTYYPDLPDMGEVISALNEAFGTGESKGFYIRDPDSGSMVHITDANTLKDKGIPYVALMYSQTDPPDWNVATGIYKARVVGKSNLYPVDYERYITATFNKYSSLADLKFSDSDNGWDEVQQKVTGWNGSVVNRGNSDTTFIKVEADLWNTAGTKVNGTPVVRLCSSKGDINTALTGGSSQIEAGKTYYLALAPGANILTSNCSATGYAKVYYQDAGAEERVVVIPIRINGDAANAPSLSISSAWIRGPKGNLKPEHIIRAPILTARKSTTTGNLNYTGPYKTAAQVTAADHVEKGVNIAAANLKPLPASDSNQWIGITDAEIAAAACTELLAESGTVSRDLGIYMTDAIQELEAGIYVETLRYMFGGVAQNSTTASRPTYFTVFIEVIDSTITSPTLEGPSTYYVDKTLQIANPKYGYNLGSWEAGIRAVTVDGRTIPADDGTKKKGFYYADGTLTIPNEVLNDLIDNKGWVPSSSTVEVTATFMQDVSDETSDRTLTASLKIENPEYKITLNLDNQRWKTSQPTITVRPTTAADGDDSGDITATDANADGIFECPGSSYKTNYYVLVNGHPTGKTLSFATPSVTVDYYTVTLNHGTGVGSASVTDQYSTSITADGSSFKVLKDQEVSLSASPASGYSGQASWGYKKDGTAQTALTGDTPSNLTITGTTELTPSYASNKLTVTVKLNGTAVSSGRYIQLYDEGASALIGTATAVDSNGQVKYDPISAGKYKIYAGTTASVADTGIEVEIAAGDDKEVVLKYYKVTLKGAANGTVTLDGGSAIANGSSNSTEVLVGGTKNSVALVATEASSDYTFQGWTQTPTGTNAAGSFSAQSNKSSNWTISSGYDKVVTGNDGIVLTTSFNATHYSGQITVNLNDGKWTTAKGGTKPVITLKCSGETDITATDTDDDGVYDYSKAVIGKTYNVYADGRDTGKTVKSDDKNKTLDFYTVTLGTQDASVTSASIADSTYATISYASTGTLYVLKDRSVSLTAKAATGYGGSVSWARTENDAAKAAVTGNTLAITAKTVLTPSFPINKVTVQINLNGSKDTTDTMALGTDSITLQGTTFKGTPSGGVVTFEGVPLGTDDADKTYNILVNGKNTNLSVTAKGGVNDGSDGTTTILYYYKIQVQNSNTAGGTATAKYGSGSAVNATATAQDVCTILANASDDFNSHTVNTTATKTNETFNIGWTASKSAGDTSKGTNGWTTPTAATSTWTLATTYTGEGPIILDPKFADNGKYVGKVTVEHNGSPEKDDTVELYVGSVTTTNKMDTQTTDANGKVSFDGLEEGKTYIVVVKSKAGTTYNGTGTITKTNPETTLKFFDITVAEGTGALASSARVVTTSSGTGTDTTLTFLENQTAYLKSAADTAAGYGGTGKWKSSVDGETASGTGNAGSYVVKKQVTFTAEYDPNRPTATPAVLSTTYGATVNHTGATISMTGYTGNFTTVVPAADIAAVEALGLTLTVSADGKTITVTGRPHTVTTSAVTVNFTATATNTESVTSSFTITVGKYNSTITATPTSGNHYENDSSSGALTVTVNGGNKGPYYDGTKWIDIGKDEIATAGALTYTPTNLPADGKVKVDIGGYKSGTGHDLSDVWTNTQTNPTVTISATGPVTVNVTLNGGDYADKKGTKVELKQGNDPKKEGNLVQFTPDGGTAPTKETVTIEYVPTGSYDVFVDGEDVADVTVTAEGKTVDVEYFTYKFDGNKPATASASVSVDMNGISTADSAPILKNKTATKPTNDPSLSGYKFLGWATTSNAASASTWTTINKITQKTTYYAVWAANVVTVNVYKDGSADAARAAKVTLVQPGAGADGVDIVIDNPGSTAITAASGMVTFSAVPAGEYSIYVDNAPTNHKVTVVEGDTANDKLYYYTVNYASLADASKHGKYGTAADKKDTAAAGEVLAGGVATGTPGTTKNLNFVTLPTTVADTNYTLTQWAHSRAAGSFNGTASKNQSDATKWTVSDGTKTGGAITLTPTFTKDKASITVTVNLNGSPSKDQTVTRDNTDQTPTTDTSGQMTITGLDNGTHTLGVKGWDGTKDATISNKADITDFVLNYYEYEFKENVPDDATGSVTDMPEDSEKPVISGTKIDYQAPTLTGYTFKGWATSANAADGSWKSGQATIDGNNNDATSGKRIYYAIWEADEVKLDEMTGNAADGLTKILGFTTSYGDDKGSKTDHGNTDFTYEVQGTSAYGTDAVTKDGITVTPDNTNGGYTVTVTDTNAMKVGTTTFNVKVTSKLNGQTATNTIKISTEPTFDLKFDWNLPSGATVTTGTLPTDSNTYIASNRTGTTGFGVENSASVVSTPPTREGYTFGGWSFVDTNTNPLTNSSSGTFNVGISAGATAQSIASTGGTIKLFAIWLGSELKLQLNDLKAVYHMGSDSSGKDKWVDADHQWLIDGIDLTAATVNKTGGADGPNLSFASTTLPDFLEIKKRDDDHYWLQLKDDTRVGDVKTYNISITVTDSGHAGTADDPNTSTASFKLVVSKAMPVIQDPAIDNTVTHYAGDDPLDVFNYTMVHDPYLETTETGYQLTAKTNGTAETTGSWAANPGTLAAATSKYTFTYTPTDTANYEKPSTEQEITVVTRAISLQVMDNNKSGGTWAKDFKNEGNTFTFTGKDNWVKVQVKIRIPNSNNSDIEKLTWTKSHDGAFQNVKFVKVDSSTTTVPDTATEVTPPTTLVRKEDDSGEWILTFEVNQGKDTNSHTLTVNFTGEAGIKAGSTSLGNAGATTAGDKMGSYTSTTASYTYKMGSKANKLDTPRPDLTRVEDGDGIDNPDWNYKDTEKDGSVYPKYHDLVTFKQQNGTAVDQTQGGLHLVFKPIGQDTGKDEAANPVKEYKVVLTGTKMTNVTVTIKPDQVVKEGEDNTPYFHYYWPANITSGPVPGEEYKVTVQAITRNDKAYDSSDSDDDKIESDENTEGKGGAGWKKLTLDMLTASFADKVFNGTAQDGSANITLTGTYHGSATDPGIGKVTVTYSDKSDGTNPEAKKTSVNLNENTSPAPSDGSANSQHDYYIYIDVARGSLYLPISGQYTAAMTKTVNSGITTANGNVNTSRTANATTYHANWEIVQAKATLGLGKNTFNGQTMTKTDIRPLAYVSYTNGNNAKYNDNDRRITSYYDIVYTVTSAPAGSKYKANDELTESELKEFMADKAGTYNFKAEAKYKTENFPNDMTEAEYTQFKADVSEASATFKFTTGNRTVTGIKLERYEAVNGTTGVTGVDSDIDGGNKNLTENRGVTYGDSIAAIPEGEGTTGRLGYYDASDRDKAKQMRLEGLKITVTWSGGDPDVYIVGKDTLPSDATWTSSATNVAASPDMADSFLTFKGAGVNKSFKTDLTFSYGDKTSNAVTYTMEKRPLNWEITGNPEKNWDNNVNAASGHVVTSKLEGDDVDIAKSGYTTRVSDTNATNDSNVGKDKTVRAVVIGNTGANTDVTGKDKAFYKRGTETPGRASIKPSLVTKVNVTVEAASASTVNDDNKLSNKKYTPSTSDRADEKKINTSAWQLPVISTKWEAWDDKAGKWVEETDHFSIDKVYRVTVVVEADTNHYMLDPLNEELAPELKELMDSYTINGKKAGEYCIEDLDEWNFREENKVTVNVEESTPFHPDWLPDGKVLYYNRTTFTYLFHTYETPTLQFSDEKGSWNEESPNPRTGTHHEPNSYVHHDEVVTEGDSGMTYLITVNAAVKDIFGAQVILTNRELLDAGATLEIVQGNGTIDTATPVRTSREDPMYKMSSDEYEADQDLIIYQLTIPSSVTAKADLYHLELQAIGSTSFANLDAGKLDVAKSYYTFTLNVREKQVPPVISGGGGGTTVLEAPVVTYMLRNLGYTSDQTAEKITRKGAKPSFVPEITPVSGLKFLGWSEVDPATVKDGKLPELVDPLTFSISDDKVFYAVYEQIKYDHSHYVIGFPNGSFGPDANITRAEVATVIARSCLEGFVEGSDYGNPGNYSDASTHWAFSAISYCSLKGVFAGYEDGTFRPDRYISRQELATVVARLAGVQANQGLNFVDSGDVANWALNGVYTNVANGWVNGYEDGTFRPLNDITRAETVKIFNGYLNRGVDKEGLKNLHEYVHTGVASNNTENGHDEYMVWPDVAKTHWAYYEIIEAANDHNYTWRDGEKGEKRTAPPEDWNEAFIDERWRYDDNANDGADNRGDKVTEVTVTYMVKSDGVIWDSTTEIVKIYESPSVENLPTVRPNEGFRFAGWSETDPDTGVITLVDPTENYVTEDKTFYAVFEPDVPFEMPKVTVTYVIGDKGTTNAHSLTEVVEMYQSPTVENLPRVTAKAGYYFAGWSSTDPATGVVTIVDPTENYIIEDKTFYAVFKVERTQEMPTVTVTYVIGEQGSAEGAELVQTVDLYESPSVEALPHVTANEGYRFAGWSSIDPATGEHNEVDPTASYVTQDITFYAVYEVAITGVNELPENFGTPDNLGEPVTPEDPGQSEEPVNPEQPEEPVNPELPEESVNPEQPEEPVNPELPEEPVNPEQPEEPVDPNQPVEPPEQPEEPENPELPEEPENPEEPEVPIGPVVYARTKYISGFEDETFRPDAVITRAAVASIIANMNGYDAEVTYDAEGLSDLEGHWAKNVIAFCVELGLMSGYEDGTFQPDRSMSRQELAVVLARMSGEVLSSEGLYFSDAADVADWAADGVYTAYANGWMNGYEDGSFQPERRVTRAEAVKMFNAYLGRSADPERIESLGGYTVLADVPETHWAYYEIIEASNNWLE